LINSPLIATNERSSYQIQFSIIRKRMTGTLKLFAATGAEQGTRDEAVRSPWYFSILSCFIAMLNKEV
jgi:hypothetical protein